MTIAVSAQILRVRELVNQHRHWFDAVAAWYDAAKWTKKIFTDYLMVRNKPLAQLVIAINGRTLDDSHKERNVAAPLVVWWLPRHLFRAGENHITVRIDETSKLPMTLEGIRVDHVAELTEATQHLNRPEPRPSAQAAVAVHLGAGYRPEADRWTVEARPKHIELGVTFESAVPRDFVLGLAVKVPAIGYSLILDDIWDQVTDAVKDKIKSLVKDYYRRLSQGDPQAAVVEQQLRDLEAYMDLHESHLARMLAAPDDMTLEQAINERRKPRSNQPAQPARQQPPPLPTTKNEPSTPLPEKSPAGTSWLGRFMLFFIVVGVLGFWAWYGGYIRFDAVNNALEFGKKKQPFPNRFQGNPQANDAQKAMLAALEQKDAKIGDVQVSFSWHNKNDLDLHVEAPSGEIVKFDNKNSKCGGTLQFDANVGFAAAVVNPAEHIFWPAGKAPRGRYKVFVVHFRKSDQPDCQDPTAFTVRVVNQGQTQWHNRDATFDGKKTPIFGGEFEVR